MHTIPSFKALLLVSGMSHIMASSQKSLHEHLLTKATPMNGNNRGLGYFNFWNNNNSNGTGSGSNYRTKTYQYDDDFYNLDDIFDFNGYSLHYGKCAKVQRFSPYAVQQGEYSSMVTDNIVILRLCPKSSCRSSSKYGCSSGYGEYAIDLNDYITAIAKYENDKEQKFCEFCSACGYDSASAAAYSSSQSTSSYGQRHLGNSYFQSKDGTSRLYSSSTCYTYSNQCESQCSSYYSKFGEYKNYLNYIGCQKVQSQDGRSFWVSPTCDTSYNKVTLGVYYDNQCEVDASDSISIKYLLSNSIDLDSFASMAKITCAECEESVSYLVPWKEIYFVIRILTICHFHFFQIYPPFYNSNNLLCNNVYQSSGKCDNLGIGSQYYTDDGDVVTNSSQAGIQCAFIDSITNGLYDMYGGILSSSFTSAEASVTDGQVVTLVLLTVLSAGLAIFSFMVHNRTTSYLLKSLKSGRAGSKKRWVRRSRTSMSSRSSIDDQSTNASTLSINTSIDTWAGA